MELAMMASYEKRDVYEAIRMGKYVPHPRLKSPESRAEYWMNCWRVLKVSDKYSGAAAMAAQEARRRRARGDGPPVGAAAGAGEASVASAATDGAGSEATDGLTPGKRQRPATFAERPLGTRATLNRMAQAARDKAFANEGIANTEALKVIARAASDRNLIATLSAPAIRDEPRFRNFLAQRADELIAAHLAAQAAPAASEAAAADGTADGPAVAAGGGAEGRLWAAADGSEEEPEDGAGEDGAAERMSLLGGMSEGGGGPGRGGDAAATTAAPTTCAAPAAGPAAATTLTGGTDAVVVTGPSGGRSSPPIAAVARPALPRTGRAAPVLNWRPLEPTPATSSSSLPAVVWGRPPVEPPRAARGAVPAAAAARPTSTRPAGTSSPSASTAVRAEAAGIGTVAIAPHPRMSLTAAGGGRAAAALLSDGRRAQIDKQLQCATQRSSKGKGPRWMAPRLAPTVPSSGSGESYADEEEADGEGDEDAEQDPDADTGAINDDDEFGLLIGKVKELEEDEDDDDLFL